MNFDHCISFITVLVTKGMANSQEQSALYPLMDTYCFLAVLMCILLSFYHFLKQVN